ncbi:MAG: endonuclease/exonuclease/phosphatase family protein [Micropepsaceae bacterium]
MNFRVANFNVENLIVPDTRYYDRLILTQEEYDAKANWIANIFNRVKPDIVGIQEVWSRDALQDVVSRSFHFANGANICAPGTSKEENVRGRVAQRPRLALISRFPITDEQSVAMFPDSVRIQIPLRIQDGKIRDVPVTIDQFQRPILKARVNVEGLDILVFVAHLKSKGPIIGSGEDGEDPFVSSIGMARSTIVRAAEAVALRHLILHELSKTKTPVIVLGDLNDTQESASTQIVCGASPDERSDSKDKRTLWDTVLYPTYRIAAERSSSIHTHIFNGDRDILDHILVSDEFYSRNRYRIGTVMRHGVVNEHLRDSSDVPPPKGASDHGIPWAEISLSPGVPYTKA